jgi:hypothetical protein
MATTLFPLAFFAFLASPLYKCCGHISQIMAEDSYKSFRNEIGGVEETDKSGVARSMYSDSYGHVSKRDVSAILKGKLGMTRREARRNGLHRVIYTPDWPKLARAFKKYGVQSINPSNPLSLQSPTLENPVETAQND